jgi:outer membrane protein
VKIIVGNWMGARALGALLLAVWTASPLVAQEAGRTLTLEEAIELARRNNPSFLMQANDQGPADWAVREAYSAFLPTATASGGLTYTQAGVQRIGTLDFGAQGTDFLSSNYRLGLNWSMDVRTLFAPAAAQAGAAATQAGIDAARFSLEAAVTLQYMTALRARDALDVARRQVDRARSNMQLVATRVEVGAAAGVDGKQAEVELGRAEVAVLQAERALRSEKLRLMEQLGVSFGDDVTLASAFDVFEPALSLDALLEQALDRHPMLRARQAQERATRASLRQARSQYFPSVSVSTAFSGNTLQARSDEYLLRQVELAESNRLRSFQSCLGWHEVGSQLGVTFPGIPSDCGSPVLSQADRDRILAVGEVSPFGPFTKNPLSLSLGVTIPVFNNGLGRERQVAQAQASAKDAEHQLRAEELRLRTAVTETFDGLGISYRIVSIEARNREVADERLTLARQRYALGAAGIIELLDAETSMSAAERDYLNAVYQFHQALVALEAATGGSFRAVSR